MDKDVMNDFSMLYQAVQEVLFKSFADQSSEMKEMNRVHLEMHQKYGFRLSHSKGVYDEYDG